MSTYLVGKAFLGFDLDGCEQSHTGLHQDLETLAQEPTKKKSQDRIVIERIQLCPWPFAYLRFSTSYYATLKSSELKQGLRVVCVYHQRILCLQDLLTFLVLNHNSAKMLIFGYLCTQAVNCLHC